MEITEKTYEIWYRFRGESPMEAKRFTVTARNERAARKAAKAQLEAMFFSASFGGWRITSVVEVE